MKGASVLSKERLTKRHGELVGCPQNVECTSICDDCDHMGKMMDKLAEYEDLEEQNLLLRLPCKIGDKVYAITRDFVSEYTIRNIEVYNEGFFFNWKCEKGIYINIRGFTHYQIGVDIFLTQSEAEEKLRELNKESEE